MLFGIIDMLFNPTYKVTFNSERGTGRGYEMTVCSGFRSRAEAEEWITMYATGPRRSYKVVRT